MEALERILSRPTAKPYRSRHVKDAEKPYLNKDGHLDFAPNDIENPKNWSPARRWYITLVAVLLVVNCTFASSSPSGCLESIAEELNVSLEVTGLTITLFLLGYVLGPLFWAPLSEFYGRRWIFYGTFVCYIAFNFLCGFAPNFAALAIGRFLTGTFAAAPLSNAPGVLVDLHNPVERGVSMAVFSAATFAGPALGPVISGFLQETVGWRWNFYVLLFLAAPSFVLMLTIPETLPSQVLLNKARRIRRSKIPGYENILAPVEATDRTLLGIFKVALTRPWIILFDTISALCAIYLAIVYCLLYMLFSIYPIMFQEYRGFSAGVGELPLIGTVVGAIIGALYVLWRASIDRKRVAAGETLQPEDRLNIAMVGGIMFPISMALFCWTGNYPWINWAVPTVFGALLSATILLIFVAYLNYITDCYQMYAASALAANTISRSALGASAPLFTRQMFGALGVGPGGSIVVGVAVLLAPIPFLFRRYGAGIRKRSKFAPTQEDNHQSQHDDSSDDEKALDEEAGVPSQEELQTAISEERKHSSASETGDRYIDASGMEKAER